MVPTCILFFTSYDGVLAHFSHTKPEFLVTGQIFCQ